MGIFKAHKAGRTEAAADHKSGNFDGDGRQSTRAQQKAYNRGYRKTYDKAVDKARRDHRG
jgi:hypothetical protein